MHTQGKGPKVRRWAGILVTLFSVVVVLFPKVSGADEQISGRLVQHTLKAETMEAPSFGAEDFVVPSLVTPSFGAEDCIVESLVTPSFGTEDWVWASENVSFGAEGWVEGMEYSDVVATGTLPAPARQELSLDNYYPD